MTTATFEVHGMTCDGCERSIVSAVTKLPTITAARADHATMSLEVTSASEPDEGAVRTAVEDAGFDFVGRRSG